MKQNSSVVAVAGIALLQLAFTTHVSAQKDAGNTLPSAAELVAGLQAEDPASRSRVIERAHDAVKQGGAGPIVRDTAFQSALLSALRTLNSQHVALVRSNVEGPPEQAVSNERLSTDIAAVLDIAMDVVPQLPSDARKTWLRDLANSSYNTGTPYTHWLASQGDLVVDALLDLSSSPTAIEPDRDKGYGVLAEMVGMTAFRPGAVGETPVQLSYENRQRAIRGVNEGLDRMEVSSWTIVNSLRKYPSPEGRDILAAFTQRASGNRAFATRNRGGRSLADEVAQAVRDITSSMAR